MSLLLCSTCGFNYPMPRGYDTREPGFWPDMCWPCGLDRYGLVQVGIMEAPLVAEFNAYFEGKPTYNKHVKVHANGPGTPDSSSYCWSMDDAILAPHWLGAAMVFTRAAAKYLGKSPPLLYSINRFTTNPIGGPTQADIQEYHRDADDSRFVALFMYCVNIMNRDDGAHEFQLGTHKGAASGTVATVLGPAGTMFLADTRGLHRGVRPTKHPRTIAWARWGVSDPPASYGWDGLSPVEAAKLGDKYPADPYLRESLRLVVK